MSVPELFRRLRDWTRRDQLTRELDEELAFHRQSLERDALAAGQAPEQARRYATRRLGNLGLAREDARQRWGVPSLEQLLRDLRHAVRGLRRAPAFTITVVMTLALGLGANAAMFSVVDQLMFRPLAFLREPQQVHRVYWQYSYRGQRFTSMSGPYARYLDLRRETRSFSEMAAFSERPLAIGEGEGLRELRVGTVSASYFRLFNAQPVLGRFFTEAEDQTPRGADVAVLSYPLWQSQYGGRNVLGEVLQVGNVRATIIGVAPRGFAGVNDMSPPLLWIPITTYAGSTGTGDATTYHTTYQWGWMHTLVRRKAGVSHDAAQRDAARAHLRSWNAERDMTPNLAPADSAQPSVVLSAIRPGAGPEPSLEARTALWVSVVAVVVFLIAVANVANLFVARALRRMRETSVRVALGAGAARIVVQSLMEGLVLAALSIGAALLAAQWARTGIRALFSSATPSAIPVDLPSIFSDGRTVAITAGLGSLFAITMSLLPLLLLRRASLAEGLRAGVRGGERHGQRLRTMLLLAQGMLSTVLLIGAALFIRSLDAVKALPMGYDAERVLLVERVMLGEWPGADAVRSTNLRLVDAAESLPGVEAAAWASTVPFYSTSSVSLFVTGIADVGALGTFTNQITTPGYFATMGTQIVRGRGLSEDDRAGAPPVAVVSESMARVLWPGQEAIGRCFRMRADTTPCHTVVGIAEDMVQRDLTASQRYHYYLSLAQSTRTLGNYLLVKTREDPATMVESLRGALQRTLGGAGYVNVQPLTSIVGNEHRSWRLGATMFGLFSLLALLVAAVGLHGVVAYSVTQRLHELGVRAALGASAGHIVRLVVGQSVRSVLLGVAAGLVVAVYVSRFIEPLLFRQPAIDPVVYGSVALVMVLVAVLASALPARRATQVDPVSALRAE